MTGQASLSNVQVAITVDDFVLWDGTPLPEGHSSLDVTRALAEALTGARHSAKTAERMMSRRRIIGQSPLSRRQDARHQRGS